MLYGGWEPDLHKVMVRYVRAGDVAYDLGANFGIYTTFLAKLVGSTGRVFAFEPLPDIVTELKRNVALNGFSNVECVTSAVGDQTGSVRFRVGNQLGSGHLESADHMHPTSGVAVEVPVLTLDAFVADGHPPPAFMKMDIEGAEGAALIGARSVLRTHRPVMAIEVHSTEQAQVVGTELGSAGYAAWRIEPGFPRIALPRNGPVVDPDGLTGFVLAVPEERAGNGPEGN
jgi:FkbM family methyltransferase